MFFLLTFITLVILVEIILRILKYKGRINDFDNIKRVPDLRIKRNYESISNGKITQNSKESKKLGWDLIENSEIKVKIKIPYFKDNHICSYKINNYGARIGNKNADLKDSKKNIGFFGCSITYGYALEEEQTYPSIVGENLPENNYLNFAVPGYSLYQALLRYKIKSRYIKFDKIVIGIHKDLKRRNTCAINWLYEIDNFWKIPRFLNFFNISLSFSPSKKSRLEIFNIIKYSLGSINYIQKKSMEKILLNFKDMCKKNNSELIVICLENYKEIYDFLDTENFNWNTTNINLNVKNEVNEHLWQLMPWDIHPNFEANKIFAKNTLEVINSTTRPYKPKDIDSSKEEDNEKYIYPIW